MGGGYIVKAPTDEIGWRIVFYIGEIETIIKNRDSIVYDGKNLRTTVPIVKFEIRLTGATSVDSEEKTSSELLLLGNEVQTTRIDRLEERRGM